MARPVGSGVTPLVERFWKFVDKRPDGCWFWTGAHNEFGYGRVHVRRVGYPQKAHRVSWELAHGSIHDGINVLHRCDNPPCVNPEHLYLGTLTDNSRDSWERTRTQRGHREQQAARLRGERAPWHKLNEEQVRELRRLAASGESAPALGRRFGLSRTYVWKIIKREAWRHVA